MRLKPTKALLVRRAVIPKEDLPLAQAAGGSFVKIPSKGGNARYYVSKIIASAILVAKRAAARTGRKPIDVLRALDEAKVVERASSMLHERDSHPLDHVNAVLAEILSVPVTMGPIRANPDGTFHVLYGSSWVPASADILQQWDAERRLTGSSAMHNRAAEVILRWKEQK